MERTCQNTERSQDEGHRASLQSRAIREGFLEEVMLYLSQEGSVGVEEWHKGAGRKHSKHRPPGWRELSGWSDAGTREGPDAQDCLRAGDALDSQL